MLVYVLKLISHRKFRLKGQFHVMKIVPKMTAQLFMYFDDISVVMILDEG
jgi:hypothetical protein